MDEERSFGSASTAFNAAEKCLSGFGLACRDRWIDIRTWVASDVLELLKQLVASNEILLHGSCSKALLEIIEPRPGDDASKRSGNQFAVYASRNPQQVLLHATINRRRISEVLKSYTIGFRTSGESFEIRVTENLYELFLAKNQIVFTDGVVYLLPQAMMHCAADSHSEYYCTSPITPTLGIMVSAKIGEELVVLPDSGLPSNLRKYSDEDVNFIEDHLRKKNEGGVQSL